MAAHSVSENSLKLRLTRDWLRKTAGENVFRRGETYFTDNAVKIIQLTPIKILAKVQGCEVYEVEILAAYTVLRINCECPAFTDYGGICKHIVATGLAVLAQGIPENNPGARHPSHPVSK